MTTLFKQKFINVPHIHTTNVFKEIGRNAYVDWLFILVLNASIALVLIIGGAYLYWQVSTGNFASKEEDFKKEEKIFDQKQLDNVINRFRTKELNREKAKAGYSGPSDPAL
jgi:hypothetical protein